ncbi:FAD-dependent oxidoreductase [Microbacterium lacticum]|uniref:protoporphyrinogen/coproporphyrinogen oxidase n=1 Tax=Microbacterium lacticum TaxID=33885 RepID=UPI0028D6A0AA|nr:FAD-dependent oxidoreductase [Microbacterium lacticum]
MADSTEPARGADALLRARRTRVVVVGGGVAGLVSALEWAKIGAQVTVLDAAGRLGGSLETALLDGIPVDLVADAFPAQAPALAGVIDELRLRADVDEAAPLPVWIAGPAVAGRASNAAPLPEATVLGIPSNAWADDVRRVIGWRGAWRAYLDRLRPPLTIGHERSLGRLVRQRMGDRVVDRLVAPVTRGLYGLDPDEVDVEAAAPGLSTALTRTGSLAGAVFDLLAPDGDGSATAPATRATFRGGFGRLATALTERLLDLGADLRVDHRVTSLAAAPDGTWTVRAPAPDQARDQAPDQATDAAAAVPSAASLPGEVVVEADVVVIATGARVAAALLDGAGIRVGAAAPAAPVRDVVDLVVVTPALDGAPRGRAVYPVVAPGRAAPGAAGADTTPDVASAALSVTLPSAEWPSLAAAAGPGRHVLRVTLDADAARSDEATIDLARGGAAALLGVDLPAPHAAGRRTVVLEPPASRLGHAEHVTAVRGLTSAHPGLAVVGSWVAGSGVAAIVADALAENDRIRSAVLWPGEGAPTSDAGDESAGR